jgi:16S rRNA (cytosine1402-N4)-methyltransferase
MEVTDHYHVPVLADEVVGHLVTAPDGVYVDATCGGGGHSVLILAKLTASAQFLAIDSDDDAIEVTGKRLQSFPQAIILRGNFGDLRELAAKAGMASVNGVFIDLGVSGHQLDSAARGFSYRASGPLDLRMDRRGPVTAADVVNGTSVADLSHILWEFGEEKNARRIAAALVAARPVVTTADLVAIVTSVTNPRWINKTLSRVMQGLRIVVNDELEQLRRGLAAAHDLLGHPGRIVVISYHSLEDRIVKRFFREHASPAAVSPTLRIITKKPIVPSDDETAANPRSRSAKLRVAERI